MQFTKIDPRQIKDNPISLFSDDWTLITAGNFENGFNTMTASWGGIGELWHKHVCYIVVRPGRYTYEFIEQSDTFTLSFFPSEYKKDLAYCGKYSGRDVDKMQNTNFTPFEIDNSVSFNESKLVLTCKKLAYQDLDPAGFIDESIDAKNYPLKDYHRMYIGEIVGCYIK